MLTPLSCNRPAPPLTNPPAPVIDPDISKSTAAAPLATVTLRGNAPSDRLAVIADGLAAAFVTMSPARTTLPGPLRVPALNVVVPTTVIVSPALVCNEPF